MNFIPFLQKILIITLMKQTILLGDAFEDTAPNVKGQRGKVQLTCYEHATSGCHWYLFHKKRKS
jgi:hypothetical protein